MVYFRSRRFYTGLAIGLIPFLFLAGRSAGLFGSPPADENERVVVRNYSGGCDHPAAAERTAALLAALPDDVFVVENYVGCNALPPAGPDADSEPDTAVTSMVPTKPDVPTASASATAASSGAIMHPMALPFDTSGVLTPLAPTTDFTPSLAMATFSENESRTGLVRWLPVAAAPLLFVSAKWATDRDFPEGVICGTDSGLPTGPMRPRC